jgi:hypothetical protein
MFGRRKAAKKREQEVAELFALQANYTKQIKDKFTALEEVKDPAEKIIKTQQLIGDIRDADSNAYNKQARIANRRANKKLNKVAGGGALTAAAAVAIPAAILAPPLALFAIPAAVLGLFPVIVMENSAYGKKKKQLLEQNPKLKDFEKAMETQEVRALKMLAEAIKTADLKEVSRSPNFKAAFDTNQTLRDRFAEAAAKAAKDELEEKPALEQKETPAPQKREIRPYNDLKGL